jgi:hypothetical protein
MPNTQSEAQTVDSVVVIDILQAQEKAAQRGALTIWTIYDKPTDYPHGIVARRHEVPGGPTNDMLIAELEFLRECFRAAGLVLVPRAPNDDDKIIETWI